MLDVFTVGNLADLGVLIFLQAVLGFDNLLYISLESKRAPVEQQAAVRKWSILVAVANILSAMAMFWFLLRRRPEAIDRLRAGLRE